MLDSLANLVAGSSNAYTTIEADRNPVPVDPAFMASARHNLSFSKRPQASKGIIDKKASSDKCHQENVEPSGPEKGDNCTPCNRMRKCYPLPVCLTLSMIRFQKLPISPMTRTFPRFN
jgi:hypothetical protein